LAGNSFSQKFKHQNKTRLKEVDVLICGGK
jgi:hypothetical protein